MSFIYFIILILSFDYVITKNNSSNHVIILTSCHANKAGLKSIPISSAHRYYFYSPSQSSVSLSFLPLLHLSYCEHQHTTYYSSSGFSILRSSPRLPLTDILDKEHSSSFHHHNAILSAIDQSSSVSSNMITTLISSLSTTTSSSSSSNEKHVFTSNNIFISKKINSLTTIFPNISSFYTSLPTSTIQKGNQTFNIMLLSGCMTAGCIILIIIFTIIKCCNRDEGSYKIDESQAFTTKSHSDKLNHSGCTGKISAVKHHQQKLLTTNENLPDSKEWYV